MPFPYHIIPQIVRLMFGWAHFASQSRILIKFPVNISGGIEC